MIQPGNRALKRRPASVLFLLGLRLAKLWAVPLLVRGAKGILPWNMAPFLLDDDRQSYQFTVVSVNSDHAVTEPRGRQSETDSHAAGADRADDISVALEWKLLLPLLAPGAKDPRPDERRRIVEATSEDNERARLEQAHECVAQTIREAGEEAVTLHSLQKRGVEEKQFWGIGWVVKKANSVVPLDEEKDFEGYIWVPVEICSPKMRFRDPRTRVRMHKVLDALNSKHRLVANASCEVHIHLGRMDGQAWSLQTLKRLGSLLWVAEPTLRSVRDPKSPNFDNLYTWGFAMRERSRLAKQLKTMRAMPGEVADIPDQQIIKAPQELPCPGQEVNHNAFVRIWNTASHLELGQLLSGPERMYRRLGFNFSAFGQEDERAKRNPRTVEFRMMDGSVDHHLILGWLSICGTIAETAVTESDSRFAAALDLLLQRSGSGAVPETKETLGGRLGREFHELMQALGVGDRDYRGLEDKIRREH